MVLPTIPQHPCNTMAAPGLAQGCDSMTTHACGCVTGQSPAHSPKFRTGASRTGGPPLRTALWTDHLASRPLLCGRMPRRRGTPSRMAKAQTVPPAGFGGRARARGKVAAAATAAARHERGRWRSARRAALLAGTLAAVACVACAGGYLGVGSVGGGRGEGARRALEAAGRRPAARQVRLTCADFDARSQQRLVPSLGVCRHPVQRMWHCDRSAMRLVRTRARARRC